MVAAQRELGCNLAHVTEVAELASELAHRGGNMADVIHQRKAFAAFIQQGSSAGEAEPKGKAAAEISRLFVWHCKQTSLLPNKAM